MTVKNDIQKAFSFMEDKRWEEASLIWSKIIKEHPQRTVAFVQGAVALKHMGQYNKAALLLLSFDSNNNSNARRHHLFDLISLVDDIEVENKVWLFLCNEKFCFKQPTVLSLRMFQIYKSDRRLYLEYREKLKKFQLDYYNQLFLGYVDKPEASYLEKIFQTGNLSIIQKILSSLPEHAYNMNAALSNESYLASPDAIIRDSYNKLLNCTFVSGKSDFLTTGNEERLKIAVCVSGQLRGYQEALKTWTMFKKAEHEFDFYCCVWDTVGNKSLNKVHLNRFFGENFSRVFTEYTRGMSIKEAKDLLPTLFKNLVAEEKVDQSLVRRHYNAKNALVIKEDEFNEFSNQYKMHYMIERCYSLIDNPTDYDLIVRIRPDKELISENINWAILKRFVSKNRIVTDGKTIIRPSAGFNIDDQFAVGSPESMREYSQTFTKVERQQYPHNIPQYSGFLPHMTLYLSLFTAKIEVYDIKEIDDSFKFGKLLNSNVLSKERTRQSVLNDLENNSDFMREFLEAIEKD